VGVLDSLRDRVIRWQYRRGAQFLRTATPEQLQAISERKVLSAFHRAARSVPAYAQILREHGVRASDITSIEAFREKVPILDKETVFAAHELRDLCVGGNLDGIRLFYSSSGHSGTFSYGVESADDAKTAALGVEFALDSAIGIFDRKTLFINCLPMGVKVHSRTLALAETSVRADVIWALIRKLKDDYEQFLLIGEHLFLKAVIDGGPDNGVDWKKILVHIITGAEYVSESFRSYVASRTGSDPDRPETGVFGINFGLSELSFSVFQENTRTIRIRRKAYEDSALRWALYGRETTICPSVMHYYPHQTYIETTEGEDGRQELVVSMLDPKRKLPLIRYNTKDTVRLLSHDELGGILRETGHEELIPEFRLPIGISWGKFKPLVTTSGQRIYSEQAKEALYTDHDVATAVTGNFRLREEGSGPELLIQLRPSVEPKEAWARALATHLKDYLEADPPQIMMLRYHEFPYHFEHDFERKTQYV
jgi:phenylacetate-coenzyme A ligase PaaK-like adenylate-forming protein